ncbi:ParB/Srx family N-terminal domain-containing protein [Vibrio harveyi]|uniref:ParB/Srx family N-terminal domain-containing protein n=1 Tax=Vibrio harveyi TaxID=669 RepID=UPI0006804BBD|nr:ParB/Srx family N-terminal domain-containing protein [Vibrio harveyi]
MTGKQLETHSHNLYNYAIRDVNEIKPSPNNANIHDDKNIAELRASMREWGFTNPLLIDEHDMLIAGHGRLEAAKEEGYERLPCIVLEGLTEDQKRAYMIADNTLPEGSVWDEDMLAQEIASLEAAGFDLELLALDNLSDLELEFSPPELRDGHDSDSDLKIKESDTKLVIGEYSFPIEREDYLRWQEDIRAEAGFSKDEVIEEIKLRLRLC